MAASSNTKSTDYSLVRKEFLNNENWYHRNYRCLGQSNRRETFENGQNMSQYQHFTTSADTGSFVCDQNILRLFNLTDILRKRKPMTTLVSIAYCTYSASGKQGQQSSHSLIVTLIAGRQDNDTDSLQ
jgi:hypothetical protein